MLKLVQVGIRIGIIHQLIQKLKCVPNRHFSLAELQKFIPLGLYKIEGLISMIQAVEFAYGIPCGGIIIPEFFFFLCFLPAVSFGRPFG